MSWNRLTISGREVIEKMLQNGQNYKKIGQALGKHRISIQREVSRNSVSENVYDAKYAQIQYENRKDKPRRKHVTENVNVLEFVTKNIKHFSPDVISGRAMLEMSKIKVSQESIYKIIFIDKENGGTLWTYLPSKKKKRKTSRFTGKDGRGSLKNQVSIRSRENGASNRSRNGHFEGDTILGKNHKSMVFTSIDRKNKVNFTHKMRSRNSDGVFNAVKIMKSYLGDKFKTLTVDNGKEFSCHEKITHKLGIKVYFADSGKPYQRGSNENFNRQLRRYLPKGIDFRSIHWTYIRGVMNKFNNTPRKSLKYRTPLEALGAKQFCAILN